MDEILNKPTASRPAEGVSFYTPAQNPPAGTALDFDPEHPSKTPTLFHPLTIRGVTLANRFIVSPMCQYSADDGHLTDWVRTCTFHPALLGMSRERHTLTNQNLKHLVNIGAFAVRGAALTLIEATSVLPNGRISPEDSGLWKDSQIAPLKRITDFVHSQGHKIGCQLSHAGRKASTLAPWHGQRGKPHVATKEQGGWPDNVWAPSPVPFSDTYPQVEGMTTSQIRDVIEAFATASKRVLEAGFDLIELHGAHGYLINQFMSPLSNVRSSSSPANTMRVLLMSS